MEEEQQRSGFWSTVPGILTGVAAVISAATGGYLAFSRMPEKATAASSSQTAPAAELKPAAAAAATPAQPAGSEAALVDPAPSATPAAPAPHPVATGVPHPSFNCALATTAVENMLCSDAGLAERDRRAAGLYFALRGSLPPHQRSQLLQSQKRFLDQRADCTSSECLSELYDVRLHQLAEFDSNLNR